MKHILRIAAGLTAVLLPMSSRATDTLILNYQLVPADATPVPLDGHWIIALLLLVTTATVFRKRSALALSAPDARSGGLSRSMVSWLLIGAAVVWALVSAGMSTTWAMSNSFNTIRLQQLTQSFNPSASFSMNSNQSLTIPCSQLNAVPSSNITVINDFGVNLNTQAPSLISSAYASAPPSLRANTLIQSAVSTCQQVQLNVSACENQNLAPGASCLVQVNALPPV